MENFFSNNISNEDLFNQLYLCKDEADVENIIMSNPVVFDDSNWKPLGNNTSNYAVVKNQQNNPVAALIEKATNSIDALLMKRCLEEGINPKSKIAPASMEEAIERFYPEKNWDLSTFRRKQAEEIQVFADGKGPQSPNRKHPTSVIIYDNGEGQHPKDFERTFLSLLSGNKNDIHFVQGKYNMGGSGSIVFCGKKRYQLIASRRYDKSGDFGFTIIREHPKKDSDSAKETWYEYLLIGGIIPSFSILELDLGLEKRKFVSGTIIKLYSYQFPTGYSAFSQDLNQSINEYLFNPALPILTKDLAERYPNNKVLVTDLLGLKWRLYKEEEDYLEHDGKFTLELEDDLFKEAKVSCFVFKNRIKTHNLKESEGIIQKRYFKNGMSVLFSLNGQVHGHYTSEFISRSLQMNILKKSLLIHVDCTKMKYEFRKELFMASRDRLKDGEETNALRKYLARKLSAKDGRLAEIVARRKQSADIEASSSAKELLSQFSKKMPLDSELRKLLSQTFKLNIKKDQKKKAEAPKKSKKKTEDEPFNPERFPTKFKVLAKNDGETEISKIPLGGEKTIKFNTDVENEYFDRIDEPGELRIAIMKIKNNETSGGDKPGEPKGLSDLININKSSPHNGIIKINLAPKNEVKVGEAIQLKVTLTAPGNDFDEIFWVKIVEKEKPKEKKPKPEMDDEDLGLPPLIFAYNDKEEKGEGAVSWDDVANATNLDIDYKTVMVPETKGESLERIFVNMESTVLMDFRSKMKNPNQEQKELMNRKYYLSVYFHTLFLYTITKQRKYQIYKNIEGKNEPEYIDLGTYLKDLFDNFYSEFILSFGGTEELLWGLGD